MIESKPLPYESLEPALSADTLSTHYDRHYKGYIKNLNTLVKGTVYEDSPIEEIIKDSSGPIFNNAAQVYNHEFYFNCLSPDSTEPSDELMDAINRSAGTIDNFKKDFNKASKQLFGSGWTWLVWDTHAKAIYIRVLENAMTPLNLSVIRPNQKYVPLLVCDLWEHAYYLDHKNDRAAYLEDFWKIVNWDFVNKNFEEK